MTIYLVRHAKAGSRSKWVGPDDRRPISKPGRRQAIAIADAIAAANPTKIVTSPYLRCRQTVEPLAGRADVAIDLADALAEGAPLDDSLVLLDKVIRETSVLCTHGDVMGNLLRYFQANGAQLDDDRLEKGSIWALEVNDDTVVTGRYIPPPR
jgi:phosphohistidine phosphatase SixA